MLNKLFGNKHVIDIISSDRFGTTDDQCICILLPLFPMGSLDPLSYKLLKDLKSTDPFTQCNAIRHILDICYQVVEISVKTIHLHFF